MQSNFVDPLKARLPEITQAQRSHVYQLLCEGVGKQKIADIIGVPAPQSKDSSSAIAMPPAGSQNKRIKQPKQEEKTAATTHYASPQTNGKQ